MSKSLSIYVFLIFIILGSCLSDLNDNNLSPVHEDHLILMAIDKSSIDVGVLPNEFSISDINGEIAQVGQRSQLKFFQENVGKTIKLQTGEIGNEGWFALKNIPNRWMNAGPSENGARNFLTTGPGLGASNIDGEKDVLLDEIPLVTPLRATALQMLVGQKVLAVVYENEINISYSPLEGNLQGKNLGTVAFEIVAVNHQSDSNGSSLPTVSMKILNVNNHDEFGIALFSNAPEPNSALIPMDTKTPQSTTQPILILAN